jgi:hypothetical protein
LLFEIFVLKNVGSGADQAETDALLTSVAWRKGVSAQHHDFMRGSMSAVMKDFIDSGFPDSLAGAEGRVRSLRAA